MRIKQINLFGGKQLFYPSEEEMKKVSVEIESMIIEEFMTIEQYYTKYHNEIYCNAI